MSTSRFIIFTILASACSWTAACGEWLPKHGGIMSNGGETAFELVSKGREIVLHLEDHGSPIPTSGARAVLHVERDSGAWSSVLEPVGENSLRVVLDETLAPGDRLLAKVTLADGSVVGGRFVFSTAAQRAPQLTAPNTSPFRFR